jgi:hypothetical protein
VGRVVDRCNSALRPVGRVVDAYNSVHKPLGSVVDATTLPTRLCPVGRVVDIYNSTLNRPDKKFKKTNESNTNPRYHDIK